MHVFREITDLLDSAGVDYEVFEHAPANTSKEADELTGRSPKEGGKSLLLKANDQFVLFVVSGANRLDNKKARKILGTRKIRFASPYEVEEIMHVKIGACYPFGSLIDKPIYVDATLADSEYINFSPGVNDKHIRMKWKDYVRVTKPKVVDIAK